MRYRMKLQVVDASRWFKNGDHPDDFAAPTMDFENGELRNFQGEERRARGWEGSVVRYFRRPDIQGSTVCTDCGCAMTDHGWIDQGREGVAVCPGDWVVTDANAEYSVCKPRAFTELFEPVEGLS